MISLFRPMFSRFSRSTKLFIEHNFTFLLLVLVAIFVILRLPSFFEPYYNVADDAFYAAIAKHFAYGKMLYRDVWDNKPPGIFIVYYLAYRLGSTFIYTRLFNLIAGLITFFLLFLIGKRHLNKAKLFLFLSAACFLLNYLRLEPNRVNAENFFIALTTAGIYFFMKKKYIPAGFCYGFSFFFKLYPLIEFIFLGIFLLSLIEKNYSTRIKSFGKFCIGPILIYFSLFFVLFIFGNLSDFLQATMSLFLSHWGQYNYPMGLILLPNTLSIRIILAGAFFFLFASMYRKKEYSYEKTVSLIWLLGGMTTVTLTEKNDAHSLLEIVPSLLLVFAFMLKKTGFFTVYFLRSILTFGVCVFAFLALFTQGNPFYKVNTYAYYFNFAALVSNSTSIEEYRSSYGQDLNDFYTTVDYVNQNLPPRSSVYYIGYNLWFYELTTFINPVKYFPPYHLSFLGQETESKRNSEIVDSLKKFKTPYVVAEKGMLGDTNSFYNNLLIDQEYKPVQSFVNPYFVLFAR
ncbi:MAG: hypothetical protein WCP97_08615 [bacterium]